MCGTGNSVQKFWDSPLFDDIETKQQKRMRASNGYYPLLLIFYLVVVKVLKRQIFFFIYGVKFIVAVMVICINIIVLIKGVVKFILACLLPSSQVHSTTISRRIFPPSILRVVCKSYIYKIFLSFYNNYNNRRRMSPRAKPVSRASCEMPAPSCSTSRRSNGVVIVSGYSGISWHSIPAVARIKSRNSPSVKAGSGESSSIPRVFSSGRW